jgi:hypothetical protein
VSYTKASDSSLVNGANLSSSCHKWKRFGKNLSRRRPGRKWRQCGANRGTQASKIKQCNWSKSI